MDSVVNFGEATFYVPVEGFLFASFEPLIFFYQVDFELRTNPHAKLKSNVLVCVSPTISTGFRSNPNGTGFFNPFLHTSFITIQSRLAGNCGEFAIIKIGVMDALPNTQVFKCITIP